MTTFLDVMKIIAAVMGVFTVVGFIWKTFSLFNAVVATAREVPTFMQDVRASLATLQQHAGAAVTNHLAHIEDYTRETLTEQRRLSGRIEQMQEDINEIKDTDFNA